MSLQCTAVFPGSIRAGVHSPTTCVLGTAAARLAHRVGSASSASARTATLLRRSAVASTAATATVAGARRPRRCGGPPQGTYTISGSSSSLPVLNPDPARYQELLDAKVGRVRELLCERLQVPMEVFASPPLHYRMRLELHIRKEGDKFIYAMDDPKNQCWVRVEEHPIACRRLGRLMAELREALNEDPAAHPRLFQVEMLANTDDDALVCLMYHSPVTERYSEVAEALSQRLDACVVGRSRHARVVAGPGRLIQRFEVAGRVYPQIHQEHIFSQSNATICHEMLRWAAAQTSPAAEGPPPDYDLLELHCGNGSFSLPLAANFRQVLSTEDVRLPVQLARECAEWAGVENVRFARLSARSTEEAVRRAREFRRLNGLDPDTMNFDTIFVDPPRCGLDEPARKLVASMRRCVYVSCNPERLLRDLEALPQHEITAAAFFDQFPFTDHSEVGVVLERC